MRDDDCPFCDKPINGPGYLVDGARKYPGQRRGTRTRFVICGNCLAAGYDVERRMFLSPAARERGRIWWNQIAGRGDDLLPPAPCAACGRLVIRYSDPLLKRVTCSAACSTSLTRTRNGNQGSGQPCETCGKPITTGRADSRTCSPACRQKAYRQRKAAEAHKPTAARPLLDARGRRLPQRTQRKALEGGIATLSGLCGAFARVDMLEGPVKPAELAQWRSELAAAERIVQSLLRLLRSRSGVADSPLDVPKPSLPTRRKNLVTSTAVLSGLSFELASVKELAEEITPQLAAQWQTQAAEALAGIRNISRVLERDSHAQP